jgi:hypothetical protein
MGDVDALPATRVGGHARAVDVEDGLGEEVRPLLPRNS